jgi:ABC-type uncharacterized transport system substrate-binding protein
MRMRVLTYSGVALLALWGGFCLFATGALAETPRVLVVHSYHQEQTEHVVEMTKGVEEALAGADCRLRYFHMDAKRNTSEAWKRAAGQEARRIVAEDRPQVVIAMDDIAQQYFAKDYAGAAGPPWFVFGGVNDEPGKYGFPAANVTGVLERPNVAESVELLLKIRPEVKRMLVLADKSETTNPLIAYCKTLSLPVTVVAYEQPLTLEAWKATLDRYRDRIDAIGLYVIRTIARSATDPTKVPEEELVRMINEQYGLPTVGFFDSAAESGVLCGVSVSMKEQGRAVGQIARELLAGKTPADFAVRPTDHGRIQLNLRTAERLGVRVPYGVIKRAEVVVR